jgi:hypothetical protein
VRVPDEAGPGIAKVTYSFDAWKEGNVKATTIEIPIKDAEAEKEEN